jgi:hypothetical protein
MLKHLLKTIVTELAWRDGFELITSVHGITLNPN